MSEMTIEIPMRRKRDGSIRAYAIVSADDEILTVPTWCLNTYGYANSRDRDGKTVLLHRLILGLTPGDGLEVDHINGHRLDCRRSNLRVASTRSENMQNRRYGFGVSQHRGVHRDKRRNKWRAYAMWDGKQHHLGYYVEELAAARVAQQFRLKHMPFTIETEL